MVKGFGVTLYRTVVDGRDLLFDVVEKAEHLAFNNSLELLEQFPELRRGRIKGDRSLKVVVAELDIQGSNPGRTLVDQVDGSVCHGSMPRRVREAPCSLVFGKRGPQCIPEAKQ